MGAGREKVKRRGLDFPSVSKSVQKRPGSRPLENSLTAPKEKQDLQTATEKGEKGKGEQR